MQFVDDDGLRNLRCDHAGGQSVVSLLGKSVPRNLITASWVA